LIKGFDVAEDNRQGVDRELGCSIGEVGEVGDFASSPPDCPLACVFPAKIVKVKIEVRGN
jgi:hypothetical protein